MVAQTSTPSSSHQSLPSDFSRAQAKKAVDALLAHHTKTTAEREDSQLLPREEYVWLVINTKRGNTKRKLMPKRIQLPNPPLPPPPATTIAIITKPPQRTYKDLLASPEHNIKFVNRVVDTDKLRGKWKPFEARRNLMKENDLWLADETVIPSLPKLLGKIFFEAKKTPIPINLKRKDLKAELGRAISSTYFHPSTGTSNSIRIATASTTSPAHTVDNLLAATSSAVELIEDGWDNVLSVGIKTGSSVMLPVWSSRLDGRFDKKQDVGDISMREDKGKEGKEGKVKGKGKNKEEGKKRSAEEPIASVEKKAKVSPKHEKVKSTKTAGQSATEKVKKAKVVAPVDTPTKADKIAKKSMKKSSALGSGSAGKRAKEGVLGKSK